ncbi:Hypothetical predicted protein [Olea europaea subsp. europaea]|uniref:Uncharacterized protein n=1 Tax=Olea europaea subsp. europaea TaxID=158383 RepID=A0A8S0VJU5_OLEEU|nr:Hypothetical predicted protein [Olea europaea subsp. europaea]
MVGKTIGLSHFVEMETRASLAPSHAAPILWSAVFKGSNPHAVVLENSSSFD